jgi:hypothetical protein
MDLGSSSRKCCAFASGEGLQFCQDGRPRLRKCRIDPSMLLTSDMRAFGRSVGSMPVAYAKGSTWTPFWGNMHDLLTVSWTPFPFQLTKLFLG